MSPAIKLMLAASEIPDHDQIPFGVGMDFSLKYDGVRNAVIDRNAYSRKMELWPNELVQAWTYKHGSLLEGFDGELIVGPPNATDVFHRTMSGITKADANPDFKFYVFDLWNCDEDAQTRANVLKQRIKYLPQSAKDRIVLVEQRRVKDYTTLHSMYMGAIYTNYEGLIGRRSDGLYKNGRSTIKEGLLLKFKEFADSEIQITGIQQGKTNQNEKERDALGHAKRSTKKAGKVEVETIGTFLGIDVNPESPFYKMQVKVGPGNYDKATLAAMWAAYVKDKSTLNGKFMTYKYQIAGVKDKPRYPGARSAKGIRDVNDF